VRQSFATLLTLQCFGQRRNRNTKAICYSNAIRIGHRKSQPA